MHESFGRLKDSIDGQNRLDLERISLVHASLSIVNKYSKLAITFCTSTLSTFETFERGAILIFIQHYNGATSPSINSIQQPHGIVPNYIKSYRQVSDKL